MDRQKKDNAIIESAILGNIGHIVIVLITSILMTFVAQFKSLSFYIGVRTMILVMLFFVTLFFWFYMGIRTTKNIKGNIYTTGIIAAIVSILPVGFFTILSQVLSSSMNNASGLARWNSFYLVGGPTLFWHRPFSFISELIIANDFATTSYLVFYANLLLVVLSVFLGAIFFGKSNRRT